MIFVKVVLFFILLFKCFKFFCMLCRCFFNWFCCFLLCFDFLLRLFLILVILFISVFLNWVWIWVLILCKLDMYLSVMIFWWVFWVFGLWVNWGLWSKFLIVLKVIFLLVFFNFGLGMWIYFVFCVLWILVIKVWEIVNRLY